MLNPTRTPSNTGHYLALIDNYFQEQTRLHWQYDVALETARILWARGYYDKTIDLVEEAIDYNHSKVLNIARLLQSLDNDCNPDNGIHLSDEIKSEVEDVNIDFSLSSDEFSENNDILTLLISLESQNYFIAGCVGEFVSSEKALSHLRESMELYDATDNILDVLDVLDILGGGK